MDQYKTDNPTSTRGIYLTAKEVEALVDKVIEISSANTTRTDNIDEVRKELEPIIQKLADHFAWNRPENEVELTQGTWQSLWYDDKDIDSSERFQKLNREKIFQVVFASGTDSPSFYYNVSESRLKVLGIPLFKTTSFLRGDYTLVDRAGPNTQGQRERNVIALRFGENRVRFKKLRSGTDVLAQTSRVIKGEKDGIKVPGPKGIEGRLFNLFVNDRIRISGGYQENDPTLDLYILVRNNKVP